jgi:hypothetical protein
VSKPAGVRELDEELRGEGRRLGREIRIDPLLPAGRRVAAKAEPPGRTQHGQRIEVRRLEQDVGRLGPDLAVLAAHDSRDRNRPFRVRDHEIRRRELTFVAVEGDDLLPGVRTSDDDAPLRQQRDIEGV